MSNTEPYEIIEEVIDDWMLSQRLADRRDKGALWAELGEALGVTDRQVKRYYTGDTPLPADKIIPLCNHIKNPTLAIYFVESLEPLSIEGMDSFDFVEELIKNIDHFSAQARVAAKALAGKPSANGYRELQAAGRKLRVQLKQFEGLYYQTGVAYEARQKEKAREKRLRAGARIRKALEAQGQRRFLFGRADEEKA